MWKWTDGRLQKVDEIVDIVVKGVTDIKGKISIVNQLIICFHG